MKLYPEEYDFAGIGIHEALTFQSRIRMRIETLEEEKASGPIIKEISWLDMALSDHISEEVRHSENDHTRRTLHDAITKEIAPIIDAEGRIQEDSMR
jgi:hypothetical protein